MRTIGAVIIGDELLSGKRQDKHLSHLIATLAQRGLELAWAEYIGDDPARILATLRRTMATTDLVFSFGGIGATPDDHTRRCAADAARLPFTRHPGALALITQQFGAEAYPNRVLMADLPDRCELVPNPVNHIPGFSVADHHFFPGFPSMAWPMLDWVLDQRYPELRTTPAHERVVIVPDAREGKLIPAMQQLVAKYPRLRFSSLPSFGDAERPPHIEFSLKGPATMVDTAMDEWVTTLRDLGYEVNEAPGSR